MSNQLNRKISASHKTCLTVSVYRKLKSAALLLLVAVVVPAATSTTLRGHTSLSTSAQFDSRSQTPAKAGDKPGPAGCTESGSGEKSILQCPDPQDDGFGVCPAFSHYHMSREEVVSHGFRFEDDSDRIREDYYLDGKCHRDDNDEPIAEKPKTPKLKYRPDPHAKWL